MALGFEGACGSGACTQTGCGAPDLFGVRDLEPSPAVDLLLSVFFLASGFIEPCSAKLLKIYSRVVEITEYSLTLNWSWMPSIMPNRYPIE